MSCKFIRTRKPFLARGKCAAERFFAGVGAYVAGLVLEAAKGPTTLSIWTLVWPGNDFLAGRAERVVVVEHDDVETRMGDE